MGSGVVFLFLIDPRPLSLHFSAVIGCTGTPYFQLSISAFVFLSCTLLMICFNGVYIIVAAHWTTLLSSVFHPLGHVCNTFCTYKYLVSWCIYAPCSCKQTSSELWEIKGVVLVAFDEFCTCMPIKKDFLSLLSF